MCIIPDPQIYSEYAESIFTYVLCQFFEPQNWLNIHPNINQRIYELNPAFD